jgi:hypothetical protein
MLKRVILAIAAIGVSSAALAHDGRDYERERERAREHRVERFHEQRRPVVVEHERPVIVEHARPVIVEPAPRVVYAPPAVTYPQPGIDIHLPL